MLAVLGDEICFRLRELRLKAGYTQEQLAEFLMASASTISKIEHGRVPDAAMYENWIYICTNKPKRFTFHYELTK